MSANEAVDGPKAIYKDEDRTILVLGFPGIGEQLAPWRDEADDADFPAHITILAPFFPESELEDAVHADLREICAGIASFDINLTSVERVRGFTFLALESAREPRALLAALRERWPRFVPYNGLHGDDPTPHLTVARPGPEERHERVATEVKALLPLSERATALTLLARKEHRWRTIAEYPLGAARHEFGHASSAEAK